MTKTWDGHRVRSFFAWLVFAIAAAVPSSALLGLAIRAQKAELARDREDRTQARIDAARALTRDIDAWMARARERMLALAPGSRQADVVRLLEAERPPFVDVVMLDAGGGLLVPAPPPPLAAPSPGCLEARVQLRTAERAAAVGRILEQCRTLRSDGGRFLWPLLALESGRAADLEKWLVEYSTRLDERERAVLAHRLVAQPPSVRDAATRALAERPALHPAIAAAIADLPAAPADEAGVSVTRGRALAVFRELSTVPGAAPGTSTRVGFVVREASLLAASGLPSGLALARGLDAQGAANVELSPTMRFHVIELDPARLDREASSHARRITIVTVGGIALAVALAAMLLARARRAQRLAELRTDFVAAVSHELRTPLASARMLAELLERGDVPPDERAEVERVLANETRRLSATLDRMLRFGALSRGKLAVDRAPVALATLRDDAAARFRAAHPERTLELEGSNDVIAADAGLLALAIDNLLGNAVKYAPLGAPYRLRIDVVGDDAVISVRDRGPGLGREARSRVFLPFERADDRLSRATEGTGVGLALVRGIARAHGGDATVESREGDGATFVVRFPKEGTEKER